MHSRLSGYNAGCELHCGYFLKSGRLLFRWRCYDFLSWGGVGYVKRCACWLGGLDRPTAFVGMPGGLIQMVTLGKDFGGDERMIALAHAARIFFVVLSLPFLLQLALGQPIPIFAGVPFASV